MVGETSENKPNKHICVGILAHVDAGKTTLSEGLLYLGGKIRELGRVDHKNAYLDTYELERNRGITIFSKQAVLELGKTQVTLLDTPGHVDFSAEMERTLQVLDYAILVISGMDGVQGHTRTVWNLLRRYQIPTFLFVNKMDQDGTDREHLLDELKHSLDEGCIAFDDENEILYENLATCEEVALDEYLQTGELREETIARLIVQRKAYPCYFGSALKLQGVQAFLDGMERYTLPYAAKDSAHSKEFGAKVFKISRDSQGNRLTHLKITNGILKVKSMLSNHMSDHVEDEERWEEKVNQIRIYSGEKYELIQEAEAGRICAVTGLSHTYPGEGLGIEKESQAPMLEPVLNYRILLPEGCDVHTMLRNLRQLEEEDPMLRIVWNEELGEIYAQLMGEVQIEILQSLIQDRFHVLVSFDTGNIVYKETIRNKAEGVGHFEPLRHYAEVHLIMEPGKKGSGLVLDTNCSEDMLDKNWQRLIMTHLAEKEHRGVLTGAVITDMKITLAAGRAHQKHTEGGDFRQATYRAVRQGLMQAESVLLEPWYSFVLEVPAEQIGRAISDVRAMNGEIDSPEDAGGMMRLEGAAPVAGMNEYMQELLAYTHGRGRLSLTPGGYRPCREQQKMVDAIGYEPERDTDNPADSVFCSHGAGVNIPWDQVKDYMHLESCLKPPVEETAPIAAPRYRNLSIDDRELEAIMEREFGKIKRPQYSARQVNAAASEPAFEKKPEFIIVDGYNLIFEWDELKKLAADRLDLARGRLMDMLSNYCGFTKAKLVLVFDGFRTPGNPGSREDYHNINVAFTKDGETGDAYIERLADEIGKNYSVRVVTSDNLIRLSALRSGVLRCSSGEFKNEVEWVLGQIDAVLKKSNESAHKTRIADKINGKQ